MGLSINAPEGIFLGPNNEIKIISLNCDLSKFLIECENKNPQAINLKGLKTIIEGFMRLVADMYGFTVACGYDVEVTEAYNLDSKKYYILGVHENIFDDPTINSLTNDGTPHPDAPSHSDIINVARTHQELIVALSDFRKAIKDPDFSIFHCYRALDSLKYAAPIKKETKQWEWLYSNINLSKKTKDKLSALGGGEQRHGKVNPTSWEDRKFAMLIAWEAIRRFVFLYTDPEKIKDLKEI